MAVLIPLLTTFLFNYTNLQKNFDLILNKIYTCITFSSRVACFDQLNFTTFNGLWIVEASAIQLSILLELYQLSELGSLNLQICKKKLYHKKDDSFSKELRTLISMACC